MGRKPTLQPLTLADANDPGSAAKASRSPSPAVSSPAAASPAVASPAVASPVDSRSPRVQLRTSPFTTARFGNTSKAHPPSTAKSVANESTSQRQLQPQPQQEEEEVEVDEQQQEQQQQQQQQQRQQQHRHSPSPARDDPTASAFCTSSPTSAGISPISSTLPASHGNRSIVTEGSKPTKTGFFPFSKGSKSVGQFPTTQSPRFPESRSQLLSRGSDGAVDVSRQRDFAFADDTFHKPFPSLSDLSIPAAIGDLENSSQSPSTSTSRKNKSKSFGLLGRSKSSRDQEIESPKTSPMPLPFTLSSHTLSEGSAPFRAAPGSQDRACKDKMNSAVRNRSGDRAVSHDLYVGKENHSEKEHSKEKEHHKEKDHHQHQHNHHHHHRERDHKSHHPTSFRDAGASTLFSGLRNSSTRAADLLSKGIFGKASRSGSTNQREPAVDDEHYVLKVINLPLVEQTRLTRISKRLEDSRDKTEFWMPAFPWRAIDYLNYKGCEVEGLYRVPGSGPQIKRWQRKFDELHDVNLFEETDLYDINIVGSMLKAWLRELPDELFPKEAQERIARECAGADRVPRLLVQELSNLPPFNYYLLFAITCHLSLLLAHSDKNKMDFRNLCICFQPCMRIDAFCFKFLVCDWRECWSGCKNEARYIEEEYLLFDQPPPQGLSEVQSPQHTTFITEERPPSPPILDLPPGHGNGGGRLNKHRLQLAKSNESMASKASTISTEMTADSESETEANSSGVPGLTPIPTIKGRDLRPLSPIQPLSPIGFEAAGDANREF